MLFTEEELEALNEAVAIYEKTPRRVLTDELHASLAGSCKSKLNSFNASTYFTLREYSFLALAVKFDYDAIVRSENYHDPILASLFNRLTKLATPIGG